MYLGVCHVDKTNQHLNETQSQIDGKLSQDHLLQMFATSILIHMTFDPATTELHVVATEILVRFITMFNIE